VTDVTAPLVGDRVPLEVGPVAHGGHCVARRDGLVFFVRHALPGERVLAEVTDVRRGYARADAVEVVEPSPDRVAPPCPYAGPGRCGGCDLQHVAAPAQSRWKAAVIREQLQRLGGLTEAEVNALRVTVESLPGGLLGWRSRVRYAVDADGRVGLLAHRSHQVVPVDRCRIAATAIQQAPVTGRRWPEVDAVDVVASSGGDLTVRSWRGREATPVSGPDLVREQAAGRWWTVPPGVFWQGHPAAADTLVDAVLEALGPRPGERVWDLYAGAGLFGAALAGVVGPAARVTLVEASRAAADAARRNLSDLPGVQVVGAGVARALQRRLLPLPVDLVVLDPPRAGAGRQVVAALVGAGPRAVAYVACDPAAFARDAALFRAAGWSLVSLRAYDCFPMTHHVECVGLLVPPRGR
jgi:tRNA/tmRNA/rRNA uracil-C5-methylase (TrmA/RlmC/RlmD family)